ncbi:MAG: hydrogenase formation protein HypD [Candidatus Fermentibacteraceae bacterium]|nr:hydrogenase formation protein HypD [Candidatus Fermentibacteraceae bacterium]
MKFVSEYRDRNAAMEFSRLISEAATRGWNIMEVCGGQTHSILKYGIDQLLPEDLELIHGPGCPVCVTPVELVDQAVLIAGMEGVIFCSFGDMLRVPGSVSDLLGVRAAGGDVRMVYSPMDAVSIASANPERQVVFFAVGFETTAPVTAAAVLQARRLGLENFSMLVSHVLVPPAIEAVLSSPGCSVDGFLAAGHVCSVMGYEEYEPIASRYGVPIVVTGFEPLDILEGIHMCVRQLEGGTCKVENQYLRAVSRKGNTAAVDMIREVFTVTDRKWRGLGEIPGSGLQLRSGFRDLDAGLRFGVGNIRVEESGECISGEVLRGNRKPDQCPAFGGECTPEHPLGAPMVSSEGACSAYYRYRHVRKQDE